MKPKYLVNLAIASGAIIFLGFLVSKTRSIDLGQHQTYSKLLIYYQRNDASLDREILIDRYELLTSYDSLVGHIDNAQEMQARLEIIPEFIDRKGRQELEDIIQANAEVLKKKETAIERFKSQTAILKNSLRYFPVLSVELADKAGPRGDFILEVALNDLLHDILLYNQTADEQLAPEINKQIADLLQIAANYKDNKVASQIELAIAHAQIILKNKPQVDNLVQRLLSLPTEEGSEQLYQAYQSHYGRAIKAASIYRFYTYCWSLILLGWGSYLLVSYFAKAREAALEALAAKSQFLATMSHEIRTPMNGVLGMVDVLAKTELNGEQKDFVETLQISAENLLAIINDILDFSKLEAGEMHLDILDFDLRASLENAVDLLAAQAYSKGLELIAWCDREIPDTLEGDPGRLRQILLNLIGNAIKFTAKGEVVVRASLEQPESKQISSPQAPLRIRFSVTDTGIGISPSDKKKLFQPFTQVDGSTSREYGGTGLGLAICKQLLDMMDGEIGVEGEDGVGSTFWFTATFGGETLPELTPAEESQTVTPRAAVTPKAPATPRAAAIPNTQLSILHSKLEANNDSSGEAYPDDNTVANGHKTMPLPIGEMISYTSSHQKNKNTTPEESEENLQNLPKDSILIGKKSQNNPQNLVESYQLESNKLSKGEASEEKDLALPNQNLITAYNPPQKHQEANNSKLRKQKILVASDNATIRQMVGYLASGWGIQVDEAADWQQVRGREEQYDLVLADWHLALDEERLAYFARRYRLLAMIPLDRRHKAEEILAQGATGYITKPIKESRLRDILIKLVTGEVAASKSYEGDGNEGDGNEGEKIANSQPPAASSPASNLNILVVDDNAINQKVLCQQLKRLGYNADSANNGREALDILARQEYDIAFMDCQMPVLNGYEATRALRKREKERMPVIALTAHAMKGDREKCLAAGMDDYLTKPVNMDVLKTIIQRWSAKAEPPAVSSESGASSDRQSASDGLDPETNASANASRSAAGVGQASSLQEPLAAAIGEQQTKEKQENDSRSAAGAGQASSLQEPLAAAIGEQQTKEKQEPKQPTTDSQPILLVNRKRLNDITDGDAEFALELLQAYLVDAEQNLVKLRLALDANNSAEAADRAHALKGASANVGVTLMQETAARLERQARAQNLDGAGELAANLAKTLEQVRVFVANDL